MRSTPQRSCSFLTCRQRHVEIRLLCYDFGAFVPLIHSTCSSRTASATIALCQCCLAFTLRLRATLSRWCLGQYPDISWKPSLHHPNATTGLSRQFYTNSLNHSSGAYCSLRASKLVPFHISADLVRGIKSGSHLHVANLHSTARRIFAGQISCRPAQLFLSSRISPSCVWYLGVHVHALYPAIVLRGTGSPS